jgi:hypothetical protein
MTLPYFILTSKYARALQQEKTIRPPPPATIICLDAEHLILSARMCPITHWGIVELDLLLLLRGHVHDVIGGHVAVHA